MNETLPDMSEGSVKKDEVLGNTYLGLGKAGAMAAGTLLAAILIFEDLHGVLAVILLMLAAFARALTETGGILLPLSQEQRARKVFALPFYAGAICALLLAPAFWFASWHSEYLTAGRRLLAFGAFLVATLAWIRALGHWNYGIDPRNPDYCNKKP